MIFSDIYKSPRSPIAKIRRQSVQFTQPYASSTPDWVSEEYSDLLSRDKTKQKEAVKRYLTDKVKTDWVFEWPSRAVAPPVETQVKATVEKEIPGEDDAQKPAPEGVVAQDLVVSNTETVEPVQDEIHEDPGYQVDTDPESEAENDDQDDDDAKSVYSTVSEDPLNYKARLEWASDFSDDDDGPPIFRSPFRFDSPETVGPVVQESVIAKRAKRRRAVREETTWNEGLACFEARRNAWTGARTVRVRPKPVSPLATSPRSPRRFFFRRSISSSPPTSADMPRQSQGDGSDGSSIARDEELRKQSTKDTRPATPPDTSNYMVETLVPIGKPLLPPNNPLRASITPSVYLNLYEKVILHNLQPSCPINLTDMLRSCVTGWKRDGEWPPRNTPAPPAAARKKKKAPKPEPAQKERTGSFARRMSLGLLGKDRPDEAGAGKGIRRSIQRALGITTNGAQETTTPTAPKPEAV